MTDPATTGDPVEPVRRSRRPVVVILMVEDSILGSVMAQAVNAGNGLQLAAIVEDDIGLTAELARHRPDVVLLDGDGDDLQTIAVRVRGVALADGAPHVVALLANPERATVAALLDAGATCCLSKRIRADDLGAVIRQATRGTIFNTAPHEQPDDGPRAEESHLTAREREILKLVSEGAGNKQIARRLWVTEQTVKFHLSNVYRKFNVANRTEACRYAVLHRLLDDPTAAPPVDGPTAVPAPEAAGRDPGITDSSVVARSA